MALSQYLVEFHPFIEQDFNEAYHWYELREDGLGERFVEAVRSKISIIQQNPDTFSIKHRKGYREALVEQFPYLVVYKVYKSEKVVFVSSISHSSRRPSKKIRKR